MSATTLQDSPALHERWERVHEEVSEAARRSGRQAADVRVVVVTKGQPLAKVHAAIQAGARIFGENYIEEALPKMEAISASDTGSQLEWHMVGHVQSRKAGLAVSKFNLIHSADSLKLAQRLNAHARELGLRQRVLLQCNVGGEPQKHGWAAAETERWPGLLDELALTIGLPNLEVCGLMTMPPMAAAPEDSRRYFRALRDLRDFLVNKLGGVALDELSMGTSADYAIAVEEGATLVRVGEAILGPRPLKERV